VGVASATERSIDEVAALHFLIGGRLHLHWLRDRIATLPRENRWQAMAGAALRDDLFSLHAELTADVLRSSGAEGRQTRRRAWTVGSTPTARWSSAASASSATSAPAAPTTSRRCRWRCANFAT
jgi:glutamate dehydrogenase